MLERLRTHDTTTFFRVLFRAAPRLAAGWWALLLLRAAMPALLAIVDRGARRCGARRFGAGRSAHLRGHRLRRDAGAHAAAAGGQRDPRGDHGRLAARPADDGVGDPAGDGSPGEQRARRGPLDGPRLRPRDERSTSRGRHGLHRQRPGPAAVRGGVGGGPRRFAWWAPLVLLAAWGCHPLAAARERCLAGPQHGGGAGRAPARGLRLRPRGRAAGRQGAAAVRAGRLGDRPVHRPADPALRAAVGGHPAPRAAARGRPAGRARRQRGGVLGAGRRGARRPGRARCRHDVPASGRRRERDRVRWPELGSRHRRRARRGHSAAAAADGGGRSPARRCRGRRGRHDSARGAVPRRDLRLPRGSGRCSTGSTSPSRPAPRWRSSE